MPNHQQQPNTQNPQATQAQKPQTSQTSGSESSFSSPTTGQRPAGAQGQQGQPAGTFSDKATKAVDQVKNSAMERVETVRERVDSVRDRAQTGISDQRSAVASRISRFGDILHGASETIRREDEFVAHWVDEAGQRINRVADYVGQADLGDVVEDVRHFARTRPALFIGGAFLAGLAIGRFFKSAAPMTGGSFGSDFDRDFEQDNTVRVQRTSFVGDQDYAGGQSYPVGGAQTYPSSGAQTYPVGGAQTSPTGTQSYPTSQPFTGSDVPKKVEP